MKTNKQSHSPSKTQLSEERDKQDRHITHHHHHWRSPLHLPDDHIDVHHGLQNVNFKMAYISVGTDRPYWTIVCPVHNVVLNGSDVEYNVLIFECLKVNEMSFLFIL